MSAITPLGFIGAGKMGASLIAGVIRTGVHPGEILITEPDERRCGEVCEESGVSAVDASELAERCAVVVLCVKPHIVPDVLEEIAESLDPEKLVISIAAGIRIAAVEARLPEGTPVLRAMPNIAATVGKSVTALAAGRHAGRADLELGRTVLGGVGAVVELPERLLDAFTGLAGSGPAYVFTFVEALVQAGLKVGLPAAQAREIAVQTVLGAAEMLAADPDTHPAQLRDSVTTPAGTTISGLHELEAGRLTDVVIRAVEAAARRSEELGK